MNEQYHYNLLGVTKQSSNEEIKKAYHAKAKKYHPDLNIGNVEAKQKFMEISEAYRIIMNIRSKKKDWLKKLIIKAPAAKKSEATKEPKSGEDIYKVITISFLESLSGCKKKLNVERYKICGCVENGIPSSCCPICNGTGKIKTNNTIMFNIPKNIQDGQSIRISGKGNKGEAGGADGDLIIRIQVKADENIIVKGNGPVL